MIACLAALLVAQSSTIESDPAFVMAKGLVGGKWVGDMGSMHIELIFHLEAGGKLIRGTGTGKQNGKLILSMNSSYGWDEKAKQVYYLDQHNFDTVYFGHLRAEGTEMVTEFSGLSGDSGQYVSRERFVDRNKYTFSMWQRDGGKLVDTHIGMTLRRI